MKARKSIIACMLAAIMALSVVSAGCATSSQDASKDSGNSSEVAQDVTVKLVVDASAGDGEYFERTVTMQEDSSALDALQAAPIEVVAEDSEYGMMVISINGLANGDKGPQSGWTYTVNDEYPTESAASYVLADGDTVLWTYFV